MEDHDQRFKELLELGLVELVDAVLPRWKARFAWTQAIWLRQEVFPDPPAGDRRFIDLVAKVPALKPLPHPCVPDEACDHALFHIEVERSQALPAFRLRISRYDYYLELKHGLPVLSLAILMHVGLKGRMWDRSSVKFLDRTIRQTRWPCLGLPALKAEDAIAGGNVLMVAFSGLMKAEAAKRPELCAQALQLIHDAPHITPRKRFLLAECAQAYYKLDADQWLEYQNCSEPRLIQEPTPWCPEFIRKGMIWASRTLSRKCWSGGSDNNSIKRRCSASTR